MEQLTKNQAVATSQEAVQNQNEPQLRDENAHNDKSVHGVLNPTYQAGLRRDAVQPDIEAEIGRASCRERRSNLASHVFDLVIGKILTSRLSLSKHLAHNLGNLLLLGKIGVFHNSFFFHAKDRIRIRSRHSC